MSDVARWLSTLRPEKYEPSLAEAEVSFADLTHVAGDDLKELGLPLEPRQQIQEAIKQLDGNPDSPASEPAITAAASPEAKEARSTITEAERRQSTVIFCDAVRSESQSPDDSLMRLPSP